MASGVFSKAPMCERHVFRLIKKFDLKDRYHRQPSLFYSLNTMIIDLALYTSKVPAIHVYVG